MGWLSLGFETQELKRLILRGISLVYLIAFSSLYWQIPGLYGESGILPVASKLKCTHSNVLDCPLPLLAAFHRYLHLIPSVALQLTCLLGLFFASITFLFKATRNAITYFALYFLYLTAFEAGGTFLWFQWDTLLLETGFLMVILSSFWDSPADKISIFLVNWLAFRLMFASGVVQLQSGCETWWKLTALDIHFESQCIPTPLSWWFHHLPDWFRKFSVAQTFFIEIYLPPLFLFPLQPMRKFVFSQQFILMALIMLSGNYNFFNLNFLIICFAMLEDKKEGDKLKYLFDYLMSIGILTGVTYIFMKDFNVVFHPKEWKVSTNVAFTREQFNIAVSAVTAITIHFAIIMMFWTIIRAMYEIITIRKDDKTPKKGRCGQLLHFAYVLILGGSMFWISMVPFTSLDRDTAALIPSQLRDIYKKTNEWQITHSYGLFRSMTGKEGRPEIILEGSSEPNGPWVEFPFYSKPGNLTTAPIFVLPHQPRLDWQMWFAALGTYQHNPFFMSLVNQLLRNSSDVTRLMSNYPFQDKKNPVQFIRAQLYHYKFTGKEQQNTNKWWTRTLQAEYMPIFSKGPGPLKDFLIQNGLFIKNPKSIYKNSQFGELLASLHKQVYAIDQTAFVWSVILSHLLVSFSLHGFQI